jgi:hypothetical protein
MNQQELAEALSCAADSIAADNEPKRDVERTAC